MTNKPDYYKEQIKFLSNEARADLLVSIEDDSALLQPINSFVINLGVLSFEDADSSLKVARMLITPYISYFYDSDKLKNQDIYFLNYCKSSSDEEFIKRVIKTRNNLELALKSMLNSDKIGLQIVMCKRPEEEICRSLSYFKVIYEKFEKLIASFDEDAGYFMETS